MPRTIYEHKIKVSKSGKVKIESTLVSMDTSIPKDPEVEKVVNKWNRILEENVKQIIAEPYEVVYVADEPLDGRESTIRHQQCSMGQLFTNAMRDASANDAQCAILNSGAIRIDDEITGNISAIDIFRALPFGGEILDVTMTGALLIQILDFSDESEGSGGYLQYTNISAGTDGWEVGGQQINSSEHYRVALNDFLLAGYDMPFLTRETDGIIDINEPVEGDSSDLRGDIRLAIIDFLKDL